MRREASIAAALLLAGCAHGGRQGAPCDAAPAQALIGAQPAKATLARARRLAHAREARFTLPGRIYTAEYRDGRLTLNVAENGRIDRIGCG